jgi:thiol-disulfide isomerase/thioredoxin
MGRLSALTRGAWSSPSRRPVRRSVSAIAIPIVLASACDRGSLAGGSTRSEQVIATGSMPPASPSISTDAMHRTPSPLLRRISCAGDGNARGRIVPKAALGHVEAPGAPQLDPRLLLERGSWIWINFWAAWCAPCKEEMPRLLAWQERLAKAGTPVRVAFVSLDDDARQLEQFLAQQPPEGVRASYWLADGASRASWLSSLKMKSAPELPEHAIVDPSGRLRCFLEGAIEEADYAEIAALISR